MPNFIIRSPKNNEEWESYLLFRWEILRKPLGMSKDSLADELEDESYHLMGIDEENNVIASGRVHFNSKKEAQIRYMAVKDSFKRKGLGSQIVRDLEEYAVSRGARKYYCGNWQRFCYWCCCFGCFSYYFCFCLNCFS